MWTVITIALVFLALVVLIGLWIESNADSFVAMDATPSDYHNASDATLDRGPAREWGQL